jgi:hypothetical protein
MKRIVKLTESDLARIVRRVINESNEPKTLEGVIGMPIYLYSDEKGTNKIGVATPTSVKPNQGKDKDIVMSVKLNGKTASLRYSCYYDYFFIEVGNDIKIAYSSDTWWSKFCSK